MTDDGARATVVPVDWYPWIRWLHLLCAATWTGGLIVLGALVPALRRAGAERALLQAAARRFGMVSGAAMVGAIGTGLFQLHFLRMPFSDPAVIGKLSLVATVLLLTVIHIRLAKRLSPGLSRLFEAVLLLLSVAIFRVAGGLP